MDGPNQNKVDMSLDEIIKLSKKEKKNAMKQSSGGGRGRGGNKRGRGGNSGVAGRGRGRAQQQVASAQSMQGVNRGGRGGGVRGRGRGGSRGRGGGGLKQMAAAVGRGGGISPLNRKATTFKTVRGGRGRGRGQRVFTNSNIATNSPQAQRQQRLNVVKAQATLLRKKEMALQKLQTAQKTMQDINNALQKTARANVVDAKRGIITNTTQARFQQPAAAGRGRGRGRGKLLTGLMRQNFKGSNMSLASNASSSGRQMVNTSVTINNQQAARNTNNNNNKNKRRGWRSNRNQSSDGQFTVQVDNPNNNRSNNVTVQKPNAIIDQLKLLKPSVSTTYKFQKNVFSTSSTTNVSLNDRFSSSSSSTSLSDNGHIEGRKVFI